jgi:tetratricopeptide (TPR) repeat protein
LITYLENNAAASRHLNTAYFLFAECCFALEEYKRAIRFYQIALEHASLMNQPCTISEFHIRYKAAKALVKTRDLKAAKAIVRKDGHYHFLVRRNTR